MSIVSPCTYSLVPQAYSLDEQIIQQYELKGIRSKVALRKIGIAKEGRMLEIEAVSRLAVFSLTFVRTLILCCPSF